ncbi:hypothetical protein ACL02U_09050 [Streptomyces sp. MS06]|uniref:hypothetical protein n=1 Tax=Streptomyces sp. MS06 TaxID=3385974 RepID=UPI0039A318E5
MDLSDDGPEPAPELQDADNNLCGHLRGLGVSALAELFVRAGWRSRSSSWDAYEVETARCRIELDPVAGDGILLNGVIAPDRLDALAMLISRFGAGVTLELYDEDGTLHRRVVV